MRHLLLSAALAASLFACSGQRTSPVSSGPSPVDLCTNLEGIQLSVPEGVRIEEGNCDLCTNMEGFQTVVPEGHVRNAEAWTCSPPDKPAEQPPPAPVPKPASYVVLAGAGDIAVCGSKGSGETAGILAGIPFLYVFTFGDNVYPYASKRNFTDCYEPTWGRFKHVTRPSIGNHDKGEGAPAEEGLNAYFWYFPSSGAPNGWYSYDISEGWRAIVLNSEADASENFAQMQWRRGEITRSAGKRIFAYWHKPLFSNGPNAKEPKHVQQDFWDELDKNACIIGNGHEHFYYRYPKMNRHGVQDPNGPREFINGGGGASLYDPGTERSGEKGIKSWGILELKLYSNDQQRDYGWRFVTAGGVRDSGEDR